MRGWFDAFRDDGGPTLYTFPNRTPVTGDVSIVAVSVMFATLYIAFLVIFPGVRKQKFSTYITVTLSLFVGLVILVTRLGSSWHVSQTTVVTPYKAFSREKLPARIGAHIGLMHVNVTLCALPIGNWTPPDIDYNERFSWNAADEMGNSYRKAIKRGLPYPILTVAEYFSLGQEGFAWGGRYRAAGYYASILLWASFAAWILMNLLLVSVPRYGAYMMSLNGVLLIFAAVGYYLMLPVHPLTIIMEGGRLEFHLGWCFWLVLVVGVVCFLVGVVISTIDLVWPHTFSTILEVYYDTPYDRHVILEESHDVRYRKRNNSKGLEEPATSLGGRILRRLSSKTNNNQSTPLARRSASMAGHENRAYQRDAPKSPWRYPFRRNLLEQRPGIQRTMSTDSTTSSISIAPPSMNATSGSVGGQSPSLHKIALSRVLPKTPVERAKEMDQW